MKTVILRRRKLGLSSCRMIKEAMVNPVTVVRSDRPIPPDTQRIIRWGCTANTGIKETINTAEAIHEVNDKLGFRRKLNEAGLCPRTWFYIAKHRDDLKGSFPVVVRPSRHAQGRNLHVCNNGPELEAACARYPQYYISDLIHKVAEYRVFVVQGRVACVAQKTPGNPEDVAWNVARGGRFDNVRWDDWNLKAVRVAVEAFALSKLDFGGVDVMVDADNKAYILEINSAPSITSPYRQECMAKCFDHLFDFGKERIGLVEAKGGYKKFIHPAVCAEAQIP